MMSIEDDSNDEENDDENEVERTVWWRRQESEDLFRKWRRADTCVHAST